MTFRDVLHEHGVEAASSLHKVDCGEVGLIQTWSQYSYKYLIHDRLLDRLVVECWHQVREVPGSIPHLTKDIKMVPVVPLFSTEH